MPGGDLAAVHHPGEVDPEHLVEIVERVVEKAVVIGARDTGIVEHDVEIAELGDRVVDQSLHLIALRNVGVAVTGIGAKLPGERLAADVIDIGDDNLGAFLDEQLGCRLADAARAAGDDRDLALEFARHVPPLPDCEVRG